MNSYTARTMTKFISKSNPSKKVGCWNNGKFCTAWADQSKSKLGVKYNRLIRLCARLKINFNFK